MVATRIKTSWVTNVISTLTCCRPMTTATAMIARYSNRGTADAADQPSASRDSICAEKIPSRWPARIIENATNSFGMKPSTEFSSSGSPTTSITRNASRTEPATSSQNTKTRDSLTSPGGIRPPSVVVSRAARRSMALSSAPTPRLASRAMTIPPASVASATSSGRARRSIAAVVSFITQLFAWAGSGTSSVIDWRRQARIIRIWRSVLLVFQKAPVTGLTYLRATINRAGGQRQFTALDRIQ